MTLRTNHTTKIFITYNHKVMPNKPSNQLITGESKGSPPRSVRVHPFFRAPLQTTLDFDIVRTYLQNWEKKKEKKGEKY